MTAIIHGKPCSICGDTQKYVKSKNRCVSCQRRQSKERQRRQTARARAKRAELNATINIHRKCADCGILLEHPATVDCGKVCGVCSNKVQRHIPPAGLFDYVPFVAEYNSDSARLF